MGGELTRAKKAENLQRENGGETANGEKKKGQKGQKIEKRRGFSGETTHDIPLKCGRNSWDESTHNLNATTSDEKGSWATAVTKRTDLQNGRVRMDSASSSRG
ncbi:hypothetical protein ACJRO7_013439 [Eucalyptus globulus]|uniref:Uncharacterized protein n=1 Tax=Eucalyptus globulus TaxID=34317 RepID=A0ABD3L0R4_EUCGL